MSIRMLKNAVGFTVVVLMGTCIISQHWFPNYSSAIKFAVEARE